MTRPHRTSAIVTAIALAAGLGTTLASCSRADDPAPSTSASAATRTPSTSPTPTRSAPVPEPAGTPTAGSDTSSAGPTEDAPADGSGQGTGNGSGADAPATVDWAAVAEQGIAAAGGGTVISIAGSGDDWTVLVSGPDGARTQSVVSATLGRVTSGPFPKDSDAATRQSDVSRTEGLQVTADRAATSALGAVPGSTLVSVVLGGPASAPVWTATTSTTAGTTTVSVDGRTGAVSVS
ncbi:MULTISPECIES: hypothetical protein [unclassified Curtobacterium]|uniref:hypothetical protein n=1 Tax=unclassified Curtobacterium TaxID=257496 RepID=UPI00052AFD3A|nr:MULTISPECIES: hypothetical protein [unclassified Curtobacterium]AIV40461.1 hypothetical protein NI26_10370 [Curtobacterium sp. MR_MD2014]MDT0211845.1 hypothetical protein [Curtobacterium sp. BRD11]